MLYKIKYFKYKSKYLNLRRNNVVMSGSGNDYYYIETRDKEQVKKLNPSMSYPKFDRLFEEYSNSTYYFYYNSNNELIGFFAVEPAKEIVHSVLEEPMNGCSYVWAVEVLEKHRGKGHGYRMLNQKLNNNNCYFLRVNKDNIPGIKLYEKLGFDFYKENKIIINNVNGDVLVRDIMIRRK